MRKHIKRIKQCRQRALFPLFLLVLTLLATLVFTSFGTNSTNTNPVPDFTPVEAAPIETTVEELLADYLTDEQAADAKYNGNELVFYEVLVEEVRSYFPHGQYNEDPMPDDFSSVDVYYMFRASSIVFNPQDPAYLYGVVPGSIVDVVGVCQGFSDNVITIGDSWIKITGGEVGDSLGY